ncbi:UNVERIFIED_ORG: hypothetical protein BDU10_7455 [Burkholderia sp. CF145]
MKPGNYPLDIYRGDTYRWQFTLWSDADKTQPVDLTGVIARSQIRDKPAGKLLANIDCAITMPNVILATLTADECAKLSGSTCAWDLQLEWPNTDITTLLAGAVALTIDVTDSAPATLFSVKASA